MDSYDISVGVIYKTFQEAQHAISDFGWLMMTFSHFGK